MKPAVRDSAQPNQLTSGYKAGFLTLDSSRRDTAGLPGPSRSLLGWPLGMKNLVFHGKGSKQEETLLNPPESSPWQPSATGDSVIPDPRLVGWQGVSETPLVTKTP